MRSSSGPLPGWGSAPSPGLVAKTASSVPARSSASSSLSAKVSDRRGKPLVIITRRRSPPDPLAGRAAVAASTDRGVRRPLARRAAESRRAVEHRLRRGDDRLDLLRPVGPCLAKGRADLAEDLRGEVPVEVRRRLAVGIDQSCEGLDGAVEPRRIAAHDDRREPRRVHRGVRGADLVEVEHPDARGPDEHLAVVEVPVGDDRRRVRGAGRDEPPKQLARARLELRRDVADDPHGDHVRLEHARDRSPGQARDRQGLKLAQDPPRRGGSRQRVVGQPAAERALDGDPQIGQNGLEGSRGRRIEALDGAQSEHRLGRAFDPCRTTSARGRPAGPPRAAAARGRGARPAAGPRGDRAPARRAAPPAGPAGARARAGRCRTAATGRARRGRARSAAVRARDRRRPGAPGRRARAAGPSRPDRPSCRGSQRRRGGRRRSSPGSPRSGAGRA